MEKLSFLAGIPSPFSENFQYNFESTTIDSLSHCEDESILLDSKEKSLDSKGLFQKNRKKEEMNFKTISSLNPYDDEIILGEAKRQGEVFPKKILQRKNSEEITLKELIDVKTMRNPGNLLRDSLVIAKKEKVILNIGSKRKHSNKWSEEETEKFFKVKILFIFFFNIFCLIFRWAFFFETLFNEY
jgi:hypothetical protein